VRQSITIPEWLIEPEETGILVVSFPQNLRRLNHTFDFFEGVFFIVNTSFGEATETAISYFFNKRGVL
jgi:hypothetical protein